MTGYRGSDREREAFLYLEEHPTAGVAELNDSGYGWLVGKFKGRVNDIREVVGVPKLGRGGHPQETWEDVERRFESYIRKNPNATVEQIREAGYGGVLRQRFDLDPVRALKKYGLNGGSTTISNEGTVDSFEASIDTSENLSPTILEIGTQDTGPKTQDLVSLAQMGGGLGDLS